MVHIPPLFLFVLVEDILNQLLYTFSLTYSAVSQPFSSQYPMQPLPIIYYCPKKGNFPILALDDHK
jgi:hypothetical protein